MNQENLQSLVTRLKACPAHDADVSRETFLECWDELRRQEVATARQPSDPIMAALLLKDHRFARLLSVAEQELLQALVLLAGDRYKMKTNPPNKLGKLIAGIIKKESI